MTIYRSLFKLALGSWLTFLPLAAIAQDHMPSAVPFAQAASPQPQIAPAHDYNYVLGPSDVIHVEALNHTDFNVKTPIGADGTIQLPYIGTLVAANMTVSALRNLITDQLNLKGVFSKVSLAVEVVSYASRYATVLGGVTTPGLIPIDRRYHLSEVLARAGGIRPGSSDYVVLRSPGTKERQLSMRDLATGDDAADPFVAPGDKIYVPTEIFYIEGQVKAPGAYPLSLNMTLAMALARGGGLTDLGSSSHIKITRGNAQLDPSDLNFKVLPDDVIDIGESWF